MDYPLENLLRRPVELVSATVSGLAAVATLMAPSLFFLPPKLAMVAACGFCGISVWRARQGLAIVRYQRNLRRLPLYEISPAKVPVSNKRLFLGRGFKWTERHTQRLIAVRLPDNQHYSEQRSYYKAARAFEYRFEHASWAQPIISWTTRPKWLGLTNPVLPLPPVHGNPALHGVEPNESDITLDLAERVGHMFVVGATRVGKTRLCEVLVTQDIRRGEVVIVFDPKGDSALMLRMYAEAVRSGREQEFIFFHLGYPDISARYNPIGSFSRITEVATRIAGRLPSEGQSAAFKDFVWRFVNVISRALIALGRKPDYVTLYESAVHIDGLARQYFEFWLHRDHPGWEDQFEVSAEAMKDIQKQAQKTGRDIQALELMIYAQKRGWHDPVADGIASILSNDRSYFEKLVSSLFPLLEKLTTGKTAGLLSPDYDDLTDTRPIFDWMQVINKGGIVYCGFDALSDDEVAGAVSSSMLADLTSVAGQTYKHGQTFGQSVRGGNRKIAIHADEVHKMIGDEFIPMVNMAGGANLQMTAYTQTVSDLEVGAGSKPKAGQIGGNFNSMIMLRVKEVVTAELLTKQLPMVNDVSRTLASSATDTNDPRDFAEFGSKNEDRISSQKVPMLEPGDIMSLPKGQAFVQIEGGTTYKIRLPLFSPEQDVRFPNELLDAAQDMAKRYAEHQQMMDELIVEGKGSAF